ncbi:CatB-related O-acetyltransferase [Microbacterium sp. SMR1]|uniref:CatB-related O-acetyltransferase n=1 Tax=Microbacterium sp. SMR1 TaxID=1497340 RepID=UPI000DCF291D|nr:CatB-related O-acetyltransferase [Microbacterium sp. SMR1]RAZ30718.1 antibiotic acetyltransferase [Microbacterium sp. SMR1]
MSYRKFTPVRIFAAIRKRLSRFARLQRSGRITVGDHSYGTPDVRVFEGDNNTRLHIGRYCSISSDATFLLGGGHPTDRISTYPIRLRMLLPGAGRDGFPSSRGDIIVEDGAWVGHEALIMSGVRIGRGAVVGARAVVTRDVPPYTIVVGNPARVVRARIDEEAQTEAEASRWWEQPASEVAASVEKLNGPAADSDH